MNLSSYASSPNPPEMEPAAPPPVRGARTRAVRVAGILLESVGLLALVVVGQYFLLMSGSALFSGDLGVVLWLLGLAALPVTLGVGLWRAVVALSGEESAPRLVLFHRGLAGVWGAAFTLAALFSVS